MKPRVVLALLAFLLQTGSSGAHYHMLLSTSASAKKGEAVVLTYQWGHPFEHQLFDAPGPEKVFMVAPDGQKTDLTEKLEKTTVSGAEGKKVTAYQFKVTPDQRGDYVFLLQTSPIWMEEEGEFLRDTVKVVLHVQSQKGWDSPPHTDFELRPLTRPYGLWPGMVFQAQVLHQGKEKDSPLAGSTVEVERYNPMPPKELPPDEQVTRTVRTDPNGVVTTTLPEAGWWCLTATRPVGTREREGKMVPVRQRSTLWVFVNGK
jgi:cobalt/nickel transport protein